LNLFQKAMQFIASANSAASITTEELHSLLRETAVEVQIPPEAVAGDYR
jgi:hypothetical protein